MADVMKTSIAGAKEMEKLLKFLGPEVANKVGRQAARAGAKVIVDEAKRLVPVRTGELRDALTVVTQGEGAGYREGKVQAVIGFKKPSSRRAHLTEFGTSKSAAKPFLRPAMDSQANEALNAMGKVLSKGITREAEKLARKA